MASITAQNVSLVFPFVGSDSRFGSRIAQRATGDVTVGGAILTKERGRDFRGSGVRAIDDISLSLKDGDRLGIYGHNGAGKTTLLRLLGGIYPPTSGRMHIDGRVTGMFSLGLGINKEVSGLENITLKGTMYGLRRREIKAIIPEIIEFSELGDYIHLPVKTYSSGMALRLQFSIASALRPDILLMDEWVSTADKSFKTKIDDKLDEMIDETPIVIIASHSEGRLASWSNRMIIMENGRIVQDRDTSAEEGSYTFKPDPDGVRQYSRLMNMRQREDALALLPKVWPEAEDPVGYLSRRAALLLTLKRYDDAVVEYTKLLGLVDDNAKYHDQFGRALAKVGRLDDADRHLLRALVMSDMTVGNLGVLMQVRSDLGRPTDADRLMAELEERAILQQG